MAIKRKLKVKGKSVETRVKVVSIGKLVDYYLAGFSLRQIGRAENLHPNKVDRMLKSEEAQKIINGKRTE